MHSIKNAIYCKCLLTYPCSPLEYAVYFKVKKYIFWMPSFLSPRPENYVYDKCLLKKQINRINSSQSRAGISTLC